MAKYTADDINKLLKGTTTKLMAPTINNNKKSETKTKSVSTQNTLPSLSSLNSKLSDQTNQQAMNAIVSDAVTKANQQKLAKLTNQHMTNTKTMSAADTQYNKLLKWSQPEYKMSDADKKEFKSIEKEYAAKNPSYGSHSIGYLPEQSANDQMMTNLANKVNPVTSFAQGALSTVTPVAETINSGVAKLGGEKSVTKANANNKSINNALKGSQTQHPIAYGAGQFAGQAAEYAAAGAVGEGIGATPALQSGLQNLGMGEKAAGFIADQGVNYAQDLALSEIPSALNDKQNGLSNRQILQNFGKNAAQDIGYNVAIPALGGALKAGTNAYLGKVLGSQDYINNIAKNTDAYQFADNPETKQLLNPEKKLNEDVVNDVYNNSDDIFKNLYNDNDIADVGQNTANEAGNLIDSTAKNNADIAAKQAEEQINAESAKKLALQQEADTRHTNMKQILKDNTSYKKAVSDYTKGIDNAGTFTTDLKKALNEAGNTDYDAEIDNVTKALDNLKNVTSEKEMADAFNTYKVEVKALHDKIGKKGVNVDYVINNADVMKELRKKYITGHKVLATDSMIKELGEDATISDLRKAYKGLGISFVSESEAAKKVIKPENLDSLFKEIDDDLGNSISSSMLEDGYNPDVMESQLQGLANYFDLASKGRKITQSYNIAKTDVTDQFKEVRDIINNSKYKSILNGIETDNMDSLSKSIPGVNKYAQIVDDNMKSAKADTVQNIGENAPKADVNSVENTKTVADVKDIPTLREKANTVPVATQETQNVPKIEAPKEKVSQFRTNTMQNNGSATEKELKDIYSPEFYKYVPEKEIDSFNNASQRIAKDAEGEYQHYVTKQFNKNDLKSEDTDVMMQLWIKYNSDARQALKDGNKELADELNAKALNISTTLKEVSSGAGKSLQSLRKYTHTADGSILAAEINVEKRAEKLAKSKPKVAAKIDDLSGKIYDAIKSSDIDNIMQNGSDAQKQAVRDNMIKQIRSLINDSDKKSLKYLKGMSDDDLVKLITVGNKDNIANMLKVYASTGVTGVDADTMNKVTDLFTEAGQYGANSKARYDKEQEAYLMLANNIYRKGGTFGDKVDEWRYLAMLANPTTHIKNMLGNELFGKGLVGAKNNLAAVIEATADRISKVTTGKGIERTKSILNPVGDKELIDACKSDGMENAYAMLTGNKYFDMSADDVIKEIAPSFSTENIAGRAVNKVSSINSGLLTKEDEIAALAKYKTSLAGYLKANGADKNIFNATDDSSKELLEEARNYAIDQAKEATFHQYSTTASDFTNFVNSLKNSDSRTARIIGTALDVTIPFKKTPANIMASVYQYSPASVIHLVSDMKGMVDGTVNGAKFIDDISKTATGTAAVGIGALLAKAKIIKTGYSESDNKTQANKTNGNYGCIVSVPGTDINFSIDELSPVSAPLIIGAACYESMQKSGKIDPDTFISALSVAANSVVDMTMLSGIAQTLQSVRYTDNQSEVFQKVGTQIASNYASQLLPTLGGKIEKSLDATKRSTYSGQTGTNKTIEQEMNYLVQKIPGSQALGNELSKSSNKTISSFGDSLKNEPAIDQNGNEIKNTGNNIFGRFAYNLSSPVQIQKNTATSSDKEIDRLVQATGNDNLYSNTTAKNDASFSVNGQKKQLSKEEWTQYQKDKGKLQNTVIDGFLTSDYYKGLSDEDRAKDIETLRGYFKNVTQSQYGKELSSNDSELKQAYDKNGVNGIVDVLKMKNAISKSGLTSSDKVKEIYQNGGVDALNKYAQSKNTLESLGLTNNDSNRSMLDDNGEDYMKTYAALDSIAKSDKNNKTKDGSDTSFASSTLTEQLSYIKQANLSDDDAGKVLYNGMSDDEKEKLSTLHDSYGDKGIYQFEQTKVKADTDNSGSVSVKEIVPYLKSQNMSESQKADYLVGLVTLSDKAKAIQSSKGNAGVYEYYQYKNDADTDGNGSVTKNEASTFLSGLSLSSDDKTYWFKQMCPSVKKIPKF